MFFSAKVALVAVIIALCVNIAPAQATSAGTRVFVDRDNGFVYFTVYNNGFATISNLFGYVLGDGNPELPGRRLMNNPNQGGMKVSLGKHYPGTLAMYRFKTLPPFMIYPEYSLFITNGIFFSR